jgi:hypothetical protein
MEQFCILVAQNNEHLRRNTARVASRCFIHSLLFLGWSKQGEQDGEASEMHGRERTCM